MYKNKLNKNWEFYKGSLGGIWEVWREKKLNNHFNVSWDNVELPHCFNAEDAVDPNVKYYQGPGWYRKLIKVNNPYPEGRTFLHFEGAGQKSEIYVYDKKVGSHIGGYDEFRVDITEAIKEFKEKNISFLDGIPICIKTDNSRDLEMIPSDTSDFNLYGGIYRNLNLIYVPKISIKNIHIETKNVSKENSDISVAASLYNPDNINIKLDIKVIVSDPDNNIINETNKQLSCWKKNKELVKINLDSPELWSPDNPQLYKCKVIIKEINERNKTEVEENFGLRFFDFKKDGPFYLNGKRLLLKGTHRHEDHAGVGAALSEETTEKEFNLIKDMGVNFIRLAHYQQSRKVLELCDKLGILVWEEIPWCRGGLGGEKYKKQALRMLDSMITQHYNHPSIIIWGMGNENDWEADFDHFEENKIREFMKRLHQKSKKMDPSRKTAIRRCDFCKDIIDIYSPSIWAGWYGGVYKDYKQASRNEFEKVDHFLHVEWGADNLLGRYTENTYTGFEDIGENQKTAEEDGDYFLEGGKARVSRDGDWSENYFCDLIDWHLKEQESMEWLTGTAQWPFKDFSTPVRPENPIPYMNLKGVVDRDMRIKEGYYVFQSYWSSVPMIHIFGSRWDVRYGSLDEKKMVKVYSNCSEAELILNGVSLGKKQRNHKDFPAAGLRWNVQFEKGKNTIKVKGWKDSRLVVDSTTFDYQIDLWENPEKFELKLEKKDSEIYCLKVKAVDKNNVLCCDADNFVYFDITGEGELIANRGTVDGSKKVQLASGTAKIFINSQSGNFVASVSSDEIKTNFIAGKNYV